MKTSDLQYSLLYSMVVAGKSATFADKAMRWFFAHAPSSHTPFQYVRALMSKGNLEWRLRYAKTGNYTKLAKGFAEVAQSKINLRRCTPADLEAFHGIGPKTARFFIIWTRPDEEFAALDTHVLKWLRYIGHNAPKSTPSGEKYATFEKIVIAEAHARGMTPRGLDSAIWDWCSAGGHITGEWPVTLQRRVP